jgi:hypothetical protein
LVVLRADACPRALLLPRQAPVAARPALWLPPALRPLVVFRADTCRRGPSSFLAKRRRPPDLLRCERETECVRDKKIVRCSNFVLLDPCTRIR